LGEGTLGPPREGVKAHEGCARFLEGGLLGGRLPECLDGQGMYSPFFVEPRELQVQGEVELMELLSSALGPLLVAILGKKLARVQVEGRSVDRRITCASGACCSFLEGIDIHPQPSLWAQGKLLVLEA
jgi:hypothetical protein